MFGGGLVGWGFSNVFLRLEVFFYKNVINIMFKKYLEFIIW